MSIDIDKNQVVELRDTNSNPGSYTNIFCDSVANDVSGIGLSVKRFDQTHQLSLYSQKSLYIWTHFALVYQYLFIITYNDLSSFIQLIIFQAEKRDWDDVVSDCEEGDNNIMKEGPYYALLVTMRCIDSVHIMSHHSRFLHKCSKEDMIVAVYVQPWELKQG